MDKGIEIIQRMTGRKPVGYRSPAGGVQPAHAPDAGRVRLRLLLELLRRRLAVSPSHRRQAHRHRGVPVRVGAGRRAVLPVLDHAARTHHAGAVGGVRGLAARVRRALPRGPLLLPRHAPPDHRPPVAHHAARGADQVHPRPLRRLARALRRGGGRGAAGAARGGARREAPRPPHPRHRRGLGHRPRHRAPLPERRRRGGDARSRRGRARQGAAWTARPRWCATWPTSVRCGPRSRRPRPRSAGSTGSSTAPGSISCGPSSG